MERRIVSVAPEQSGWRIQFADRVPLVLAGLQPAIVAACNLAREVHRASGQPTAVKVRMNCGDGVMMGYHG
jgi:hypothetical protein